MESQKAGNDRRWYVLLTVGIGTFLSSLNTSITNTVLPAIEQSLRITFVQSEWVVLIYLLVLTLFLVPIGRLSDVWGHRFVFLLGFALFTGAAVICGLSENLLTLLAGRGLLALGGAMILSVGPALITTTFPAELRGRVLGIQAIMTYIGQALGPVLGGWLTQYWGWEVTFFVTVPFGVIGLLLGLWVVPKVAVEERKRVDRTGMILFIAGMASLILLLNSNAITQNRTLIVSLLGLVFVGTASAFVYVENKKQADPLINLKLFRIRNFGFGSLSAALNYLCFFLTLFLLPFYFDQVLHFSESQIGLYLTITPLVMVFCAPAAGALSDKTGPRALTAPGMFFSTVSLALFGVMGYLPTLQAHWLLVIGLILAGLGTGTFAAPNNSAIMGAAPRSQQGLASGVLATFRYIGMMAGITIGGSLFDLFVGYFTRQGAGSTAAFVHAFAVAMWVGAGFGAIGIVCTFAMTNESRHQ